MFDGDKMEQKELVPMEQRKEEGNNKLKHWELKKEPYPGYITTKKGIDECMFVSLQLPPPNLIYLQPPLCCQEIQPGMTVEVWLLMYAALTRGAAYVYAWFCYVHLSYDCSDGQAKCT